jgi:hypothetical protein
LKRVLATLAALLGTTSAVQAQMVPNFTQGTVTTNTESKTTVVETIRTQEYSNGFTYVVTGTNVLANETGTPIPQVTGNGTTAIATPTCTVGGGNLCYGSTYSVINQGQPFQLTETYNGPGIFRETEVNRTTTQEAKVNSLSVFTQ